MTLLFIQFPPKIFRSADKNGSLLNEMFSEYSCGISKSEINIKKSIRLYKKNLFFVDVNE